MILWHLTSRGNVESILEHGLIPQFRDGFQHGGRKGIVSLTDDPAFMIRVLPKWPTELVAVRVRVQGLLIRVTMLPTRFPRPAPHEFEHVGMIAPRFLDGVDACGL